MHWPWTRREPAEDDLKATVRELQREVNALKLEWSEVMDKMLHRLQRQSKRDRDAAVRLLEPSQSTILQGPSPSAGGSRSERLAAARARLAATRGLNGQA